MINDFHWHKHIVMVSISWLNLISDPCLDLADAVHFVTVPFVLTSLSFSVLSVCWLLCVFQVFVFPPFIIVTCVQLFSPVTNQPCVCGLSDILVLVMYQPCYSFATWKKVHRVRLGLWG